jgi:hypothetical protein
MKKGHAFHYAAPRTCTDAAETAGTEAFLMTRLTPETTGCEEHTPQIIIRLLGRSIRSHAVSTGEIFSRFGLGMQGRSEPGRKTGAPGRCERRRRRELRARIRSR